MAKTVYCMKVSLEVTVDPTKPKTLTDAAEWLEKVGEGKIIEPPAGMSLHVETISAPDIVKRKDK